MNEYTLLKYSLPITDMFFYLNAWPNIRNYALIKIFYKLTPVINKNNLMKDHHDFASAKFSKGLHGKSIRIIMISTCS